MAEWNVEEADGVASNALTMLAPELWPAIVILEEEPPKLGTTFCKNFNAFIVSFTALLVMLPSGDMKPSYSINKSIAMRETMERHETHCSQTILNNCYNGIGCCCKFRPVETWARCRSRNKRAAMNPTAPVG